MSSQIKFFPKDSVEFLEHIRPNYVMDEKLLSTDWLGDKPLIITYSPYEFKDNGKSILALWKKNAIAWESKTSKTFKFIVKPDIEITEDDKANNSFLIYGLPDKIAEIIPIKVKDGRFIIGENSYEGDALQLSIVIPSPFNPSRFIAAMAASRRFGGIKISEVGGYSLTRNSYIDAVEEGCLEFDGTGKATGFQWRKQYPDDSNWLCTTYENHILCVRPGSHAESDIKKLIEIHETAYKKITRTLNIRSKKPGKIVCFIHQIDSEIRDPGSGDYCRNGTIHTIYNDERIESYAGHHELVHAITDKYFGISAHLFVEGLATLLGSTLKKSIDFYIAELLYLNELAPLSDLLVRDTFKSLHFSISFMQSASFVKYLISRYGWRRFIHLYKVSAKCKSKTVADFIPQIYKKSLVDMEKEWKAYIAAFLNEHRDEIVSASSLWAAKRNLFRKDYSTALSYIEDCLKKSTNDPEVYWLAGKAHFFIGNYEKSIDSFLKAASLPTGEAGFVPLSSYFYLGKIHDLMGERDAAVKYYHTALEYPEYNYEHDEARKFLHTPYSREET